MFYEKWGQWLIHAEFGYSPLVGITEQRNFINRATVFPSPLFMDPLS